eukprot:1031174-Pleurochrysis_carterae.AAC.1
MRLPGAPAPGDCPLHPTAATHCLRPFSTTPTLARLTAVRGGCGRRPFTVVHIQRSRQGRRFSSGIQLANRPGAASRTANADWVAR